MGHLSDPGFLVLHGLRLKGLAEVPVVAELTGLAQAEVRVRLERAGAEELVLRRDGRISGWSLTPAGRGRHAELLVLDIEDAGCREELAGIYPRFGELNGDLKVLCTDWQLRDGAPNDHTDAAYDAAVIDRLARLDSEVQPVCRELSGHLGRLSPYGPRLDGAVRKVTGGDRDRFTRPLANSYHDIWMELHEDLICSLGLARTAADA